MINSLIPTIVIRIKISPETKTPRRAVSQGMPIPNTTEYVKKAFNPIPGAKAIGYLATTPIMIVPIAAASAVATKTAPVSIPVGSSTLGFTNKMYAIARNVVIPPMISLL